MIDCNDLVDHNQVGNDDDLMVVINDLGNVDDQFDDDSVNNDNLVDNNPVDDDN